MSFVFAEHYHAVVSSEIINTVNVYSDTKVSLLGAKKLHWSERSVRKINRYGIAKTLILQPNCSISFAGNDISLANELFRWIANNSPCELEDVVNKAYEIHCSSRSRDDIEFLICSSDGVDDNCKLSSPCEIICIKNGDVNCGCDKAWIGSCLAFEKLQQLRALQNYPEGISSDIFEGAMRTCGDDSVGGFSMEVTYLKDHFEYREKYCSVLGFHDYVIKPGESLSLYESAQNGGFATYQYDFDGEPRIDFIQSNTSVLYTRKYRYSTIETNDDATRFLLLPIVFTTDTNSVLS